MSENSPKFYGVWQPGRGWLKVQRDGGFIPFADVHQDVAREVARFTGQGAQVRFIDAAIASLERQWLEVEINQRIMNRMRKLWHTLTSFLRFKNK